MHAKAGTLPRWPSPGAFAARPLTPSRRCAGGVSCEVDALTAPSPASPALAVAARTAALRALCALPSFFALVASTSATAAEVSWEGFYRARGDVFDSLSLSDTNTAAEAAAWTTDHRMRLRPGLLLSDKVSLFTQVDLLPFVQWGDQPVVTTDPLTGEDIAVVYSDAVAAPITVEGGSTPQNLAVTRLWGEVKLKYGTLRIGRIPNEWGTGMVFNAGNRPVDEFGDTVDRVQFTSKVKSVFLMGGLENRSEGFAAEKDDYRAVVASVLYQGEKSGVGTFHTYRFRTDPDQKYTTWIGDIWGRASLGMIEAEIELAAIVGGGDLDDGVNDIRQVSFGGNLQASLDTEGIRAGLLAGFATGDQDPNDTKVRAFSYDPDFNVSLFLFEEPMPVLKPAVSNGDNGGRTTAAARTGYSISNALFLKPRIGWRFNEELTVDASYLVATQAKEDLLTTTGRGYGGEVNLNVRYDPFPHFWVQGTGGVYMPGKYITEYTDADLGTGFNRPALGGRLLTTFEF